MQESNLQRFYRTIYSPKCFHPNRNRKEAGVLIVKCFKAFAVNYSAIRIHFCPQITCVYQFHQSFKIKPTKTFRNCKGYLLKIIVPVVPRAAPATKPCFRTLKYPFLARLYE